jgi:succinoglycan biosynthesis transport protein ExoP
METQESTRYQNPMDYLKIFFRRKWLFIAPLFAGLVLSISACFVMPPTYESYTLILIEEEKIINPLIQGLAISTTASQRMQTIREQLLGWNSLVGLTKRLNLAKDVQNQLQFENLILSLRKDITVRMPQSNIIRISYFGKEPEETRLVTKTLTDILVDENMRSQTKETDVAITFIKEQLEVYKRRIKETEVANLEEQLKTLLADSTEQHPLVRELRGRIAIAKKELDSGEYQIPNTPISTDNPTYQALKTELDKITSSDAAMGSMAYASVTGNEPNDPNNAIYKLMLMDKVDSAMARDKDVNEMIYKMLLQKLETAKITQRLEASKEGTRYTVIDPPRLPLRTAKPNKLMVILLGMFLGGCTGTGMVFGREFLDQSFLDIDDAKQSLEFPILGGISRITTLEEIDKEKYQKKRLITISIASSCVLIIISMLYYLFRK